MTSKVTYKGELRTNCEHLASGSFFTTDAPIDNNGLGQAFSPTDTVATGLACCMLTMMGIKANGLEVDLKILLQKLLNIWKLIQGVFLKLKLSLHYLLLFLKKIEKY